MTKKKPRTKEEINKLIKEKATPKAKKTLKEQMITEYQQSYEEPTHPNNNFLKNTKV